MRERRARVSRLHGGFSRHLRVPFPSDDPPGRNGEANPKWGNTLSDEQNPTPEPGVTPEAPAQETDWRKHARTWEERAKAANAEIEALREKASKLDEIEEAKKTAEQKQAEELEKLRTRAAELESELSAKDRQVLVERVAAKTGVDPEDLRGDTEDDLVASAEKFIEKAKLFAEQSKPAGYVPSQGTGTPTPPTTSLDEVRERAKKFPTK